VPADAEVYVSPRYGTTDANSVVQAPPGAAADDSPTAFGS
jgi:hypothetical protein